jgi:hypothetical protein
LSLEHSLNLRDGIKYMIQSEYVERTNEIRSICCIYCDLTVG